MNQIPVFYSTKMLSFSPSAGKPGVELDVRDVIPATIRDLCRAHDPQFVTDILAG